MAKYVWTIQPSMGRLGEADWSVIQGTSRRSGLQTRDKAQRWAVQQAKDASIGAPEGSEMIVELDLAQNGSPGRQVWKSIVQEPQPQIKNAPVMPAKRF